jgi:molybdopterin/thiamine biosynthesis adenylyltransferase/ubiquitin-protein ligase
MTWWLLQHSRLGNEKAALAELEGSVDWLSVENWQANNDLEMCVAFAITHGDQRFGFRMRYPNIFPDAPPMIFTDDASKISNHQYGADGELCLEHRPDNWHPSITGADMVASCQRLIAEEHPETGEIVHARSAHTASLGRELRSQSCRFLMSERDLVALNSLRDHQASEFTFSERKTATIYVASLTRIGLKDDPTWVSDLILPEGYAPETGTVLRVPGAGDFRAVDAKILGAFLDHQDLGDLRGSLLDTDALTYLLLGDQDRWELFAIFGKADDRKILPYMTVMVPTAQQRLPDEFKVLTDKTVGIVGCGSVGSKVAASLCRTGVGKFLLIDEDIFFPGNAVRNELDLSVTGAHKAVGLRERLKNLAPEVSVRVFRMTLGGQESAASTVGALQALGDCDVLIDATGAPTAFNMIASMATRESKPMVWAAVFAGGIGGLVCRARPNVDPVPLLARGQIDRWFEDQGVEWIRPHDPERYRGQSADGTPMVADDAEVSVIAAHASRFVIDLLARPDGSIFPFSAYVIGLSSEWLFDQPFDTRPIDLIPAGEWGERVEPLDADALVETLKAHLPPREDADAVAAAN